MTDVYTVIKIIRYGPKRFRWRKPWTNERKLITLYEIEAPYKSDLIYESQFGCELAPDPHEPNITWGGFSYHPVIHGEPHPTTVLPGRRK